MEAAAAGALPIMVKGAAHVIGNVKEIQAGRYFLLKVHNKFTHEKVRFTTPHNSLLLGALDNQEIRVQQGIDIFLELLTKDGQVKSKHTLHFNEQEYKTFEMNIVWKTPKGKDKKDGSVGWDKVHEGCVLKSLDERGTVQQVCCALQ